MVPPFIENIGSVVHFFPFFENIEFAFLLTRLMADKIIKKCTPAASTFDIAMSWLYYGSVQLKKPIHATFFARVD